jgi:hypothetical protein
MPMARGIARKVVRRCFLWLRSSAKLFQQELEEHEADACMVVCRVVPYYTPDPERPGGIDRYVAKAVWNHFNSRSRRDARRPREVPLTKVEKKARLDDDDNGGPKRTRLPRVRALESTDLPHVNAEVRDMQSYRPRLLEQLHRVHSHLHPYARAAWVEGKSAPTIAGELGVSERTAQYRIRQARAWADRKLEGRPW